MRSGKDVMIDIETMGQTPGCAIVSIGAVEFDWDGLTGVEFYRVVNLESCVKFGLNIEPGTVMWWLNQSKAARSALQSGEPLDRALVEFSAWFTQFGQGTRIWSYGANFDPVLLEAAYRAVALRGYPGMREPWHYRAVRCARTMYDEAGVDLRDFARKEGTLHNALSDAKDQALALVHARKAVFPLE